MEKNWLKIYSSANSIEIEISKQMLKENNIIAVVLNKQDSNYNMFGSIDLYVKKTDREDALRLMDKQRYAGEES